MLTKGLIPNLLLPMIAKDADGAEQVQSDVWYIFGSASRGNIRRRRGLRWAHVLQPLICLAADDLAKHVEVIGETKKLQQKSCKTGRGVGIVMATKRSMTQNITITMFEHLKEGGKKQITKYHAAEQDHWNALDHWIRHKTFNMDLATPARDCLRECSHASNDVEQISTMEVDLATFVHGGEREALHSGLRHVLEDYLHMDLVEVGTRTHGGLFYVSWCPRGHEPKQGREWKRKKRWAAIGTLNFGDSKTKASSKWDNMLLDPDDGKLVLRCSTFVTEDTVTKHVEQRQVIVHQKRMSRSAVADFLDRSPFSKASHSRSAHPP